MPDDPQKEGERPKARAGTGGARKRRRSGSKAKAAAAAALDVHEVFVRELRGILDGESRLARFLNGLEGRVQDTELQELVRNLAECSSGHQRILRRVAAAHVLKHVAGGRRRCRAVAALVEEAQRGLQAGSQPVTRDFLTITNLQKLLHHGIATYGSLRAWSELIDDEDAVIVFRRFTDELRAFDAELSRIAEDTLWARRRRGRVTDEQRWERGNGGT